MTSPAELLKTAADDLDRLTAEVADLTAKNTKLASDNVALAQAIKDGSEVQRKTAADLGDLALAASKELVARGLVKEGQDADRIASAILGSHTEAISAIIKVAKYASTVQKLGTTVISDSVKPETADDCWDRCFSTKL